jgi:Holliday junction DNA helicase RuvA
VIGSLRGTVLERTATGAVLLEVAGVGYRVAVTTAALSRLVPGEAAFLFTHLHVRDDALDLYGFDTRDERDTFEALLGANGVGPKLALAAISAITPPALRRAVAESDLDALTVVPGIGKRLAQRLLVDLQARLDGPEREPVVTGTAPSPRAEVRAALTELGYGPEEVRDALGRLPDDGSVESLLRDALRQLAGSRA